MTIVLEIEAGRERTWNLNNIWPLPAVAAGVVVVPLVVIATVEVGISTNISISISISGNDSRWTYTVEPLAAVAIA